MAIASWTPFLELEAFDRRVRRMLDGTGLKPLGRAERRREATPEKVEIGTVRPVVPAKRGSEEA